MKFREAKMKIQVDAGNNWGKKWKLELKQRKVKEGKKSWRSIFRNNRNNELSLKKRRWEECKDVRAKMRSEDQE